MQDTFLHFCNVLRLDFRYCYCYIMVLLVKNRFLPVSPTNLSDFYSQNPKLLTEAKDLAAKKPLSLDPSGILYVRQKQWAATHPGDKLDDGQVRSVTCESEDFLIVAGGCWLWNRRCSHMSCYYLS